ncbi:hypothetical protein F4780DRAFT_729985 [Xylariomycetidae sp. FL0641]|nr:hypothetical protein F4780DRAFT_729985 [Xylariomycetidae sp. FL0641]
MHRFPAPVSRCPCLALISWLPTPTPGMEESRWISDLVFGRAISNMARTHACVDHDHYDCWSPRDTDVWRDQLLAICE